MSLSYTNIFPFDPPLLNSASPWATTRLEIEALYRCTSTGAVTIRTALLGKGYEYDEVSERHCYFESGSMLVRPHDVGGYGELREQTDGVSSLNSFGYSPISLNAYCQMVQEIESKIEKRKPVIFSVAGPPQKVGRCFDLLAKNRGEGSQWLMEINLSCPNIPGKPPPAFSRSEMHAYLAEIGSRCPAHDEEDDEEGDVPDDVAPLALPVGLKLPPYTYQDQFDSLTGALRDSCKVGSRQCPISFLTSTNTLGGCLVLDSDHIPTLESRMIKLGVPLHSGIGGMAGAALHPLALGNVAQLRWMLDNKGVFPDIYLIGVGGVYNRQGFDRMKAAGADAVGIGTALGARGMRVFERISSWENPDE